MQSSLRAIVMVLGTSLAFFIGQILAALLFFIVFSTAGQSSDEIADLFDTQWLQLGVGVVFSLFMIGFIFLVERATDWKAFIKQLQLDKKPSLDALKKVFIAFVLYFVLFLFLVAIVSLIPGFNRDQEQQVSTISPVGMDYVYLFLSLIVVAPIIEEVVFRGFLFRRLAAIIPVNIALIGSSVVFGLFHLEFFSDAPLNWVAALNTFALAILLCWVLLETKNLWSAIVLHALKNGIAFFTVFVF